jgi:hypothetical protein
MTKQQKHFSPEEKVSLLEQKLQAKNQVLAELVEEHVALKVAVNQ